MTAENPQYQAIIEICQKSQAILDKRVKEVGLRQALAEFEPYETMWREYWKQVKKPVEFRGADFSRLLFIKMRFANHKLIDCNFSGSRWFFSRIRNCDCTGSNFSGITVIPDLFENTDCTNCDFTNAHFNFFDFWERNNFANANFTNAELNTFQSSFKGKTVPSQPEYKNAIMNGCKLTIEKSELPEHNTTRQELKSLLDKMFSPDQLAVMHIDYAGRAAQGGKKSGCFIATAACGLDSEEVMILRYFRDTVLLSSAVGHLFVKAYYWISPPIASLIENSPKAKSVIRNLLVVPVAKLVDRRYNVTRQRGN